MSEHADLTKWNVAQSIEHNLNATEAVKSYSGMLDAADYDLVWQNPRYITETAEYMLTQKDGLYGVSHQQITEWLMREIGLLVIETVIFEERTLKSA